MCKKYLILGQLGFCLAIGVAMIVSAQNIVNPASVQAQQKTTTADADSGGEQVGPDEKIRSLLEERVAILKSMLEAAQGSQTKGGISADAVWRLEARWLNAQLDLCQTDSQRLEFHEKIVKVLRTIEEAYVRSSKLTSVQFELQEARLSRLEAEITLNAVKARILRDRNPSQSKVSPN